MMPVIGPAPRHRNLWFAFGHAHHGLTLGPVTGRLVAEMVCGEKPFVDPAPYLGGGPDPTTDDTYGLTWPADQPPASTHRVPAFWVWPPTAGEILIGGGIGAGLLLLLRR